MSELRIVVDHLKLDYKGPLEFNALIKLITALIKEKGFDIRHEKDFEQNTKTGKHIEWQISPWKVISDYARQIIKVRILASNMIKTEAVKDKKKVKIDNARVIIYIDGMIEFDYFHKWDNNPFFLFLRTLYDKFVYRVYTERFEQRLVYDTHHVYNRIEKFLNVYTNYKVITEPHQF
ncbi:hypothetical protein ISS05_02010 [Candidatus Woesearchaeota archaeon]|nr:hypothetical protein [Candidatus Woesearchaeota archaeon]